MRRAVILMTFAVASGCGLRDDRRVTLPVGARLTLSPEESTLAAAVPPANVRLYFEASGLDLDPASSGRIALYGADPATPVFSFALAELPEQAERTGCTPALRAHVANALRGEALFCGGALRPGEIRRFVLERPGKRPAEATAAVHVRYDAEDDLLSVAVMFQ